MVTLDGVKEIAEQYMNKELEMAYQITFHKTHTVLFHVTAVVSQC